MKGMIGKKVGMTQVLMNKGRLSRLQSFRLDPVM